MRQVFLVIVFLLPEVSLILYFFIHSLVPICICVKDIDMVWLSLCLSKQKTMLVTIDLFQISNVSSKSHTCIPVHQWRKYFERSSNQKYITVIIIRMRENTVVFCCFFLNYFPLIIIYFRSSKLYFRKFIFPPSLIFYSYFVLIFTFLFFMFFILFSFLLLHVCLNVWNFHLNM